LHERAKCSDQRRRRNKKWITAADVVVAARKKVPQLVRQQNGHQRNRERQAGQQRQFANLLEREAAE
jgi:hypothetical protein